MGRNFPRLVPATSGVFVTTASLQVIAECEGAIFHLGRHGFYNFQKKAGRARAAIRPQAVPLPRKEAVLDVGDAPARP